MTTLAPDRPTTTDAEAFRWMPLLGVLVGTFVTFLDFFIVNVALESIGARLHAGPAAVQLVVAGYGMAFAAGMISGGRLGDLFGRRRMFVVGLALFTVTSLACGLAPDAASLVVARVLQGASGALLTPQVLALLATVYPGRWRARAFAGYGFAMGIAGVLGQLIGGVLIDADLFGLGWRTIFLINVPLGVVTLLLVPAVVPESRGRPARLDLLGTALVTLGLLAVVLPLVKGREQGWPAWTWWSFAAAVLLFAAFGTQQRRRAGAGRDPLVHPDLMRSRSFAVGSVAALTFSLVPPSFFFVLALYLQGGRGYSPAFSGVVFVAVGAGYFLALLMATSAAGRLGRQVLALGALVVCAGCLVLALVPSGGSSVRLVPGLAAIGFGIGLVLVPLTAMALADLDAQHAGAASGVLSTAQQVGGALGVVVVGMIFFGASDDGVPHAFSVSLIAIAALTGLTATLVQLLPRRTGLHRSVR